MDVMILVSSRESATLFRHLGTALNRGGIKWACFSTNDGVELMKNKTIVEIVAACDQASVCEHSWQKSSNDSCPVELGSQTQNSLMMSNASRVVSL